MLLVQSPMSVFHMAEFSFQSVILIKPLKKEYRSGGTNNPELCMYNLPLLVALC